MATLNSLGYWIRPMRERYPPYDQPCIATLQRSRYPVTLESQCSTSTWSVSSTCPNLPLSQASHAAPLCRLPLLSIQTTAYPWLASRCDLSSLSPLKLLVTSCNSGPPYTLSTTGYLTPGTAL